MLEMFVDAHELLDCVEVHVCVFGVHALHAALLAEHDAVAFRDAYDLHEVAHDVIEHHLLVALVREKVMPDVLLCHLEFELLPEGCLHVRGELVDVHAMGVLSNVSYDLVKDCVPAASIRTQRAGAHALCMLNK
jgi:hypothetical protein